MAVSIHLRRIGNDDYLQRAFSFFDQNKSGYIEIDELRTSLADEAGPNHDEVINAIIHDVDTDKVSIYSFFFLKGNDWWLVNLV